MADKQIKSITFPDLPDRYTFLQSDTTLTQSGKAADAKAVGDEIEALKEDLSTLNTEGTVPTSEQMLSENVTVDSVPYHFRKTASDNADREELEIVGGSVTWNQLARDIRDSNVASGVTMTNNEDGSCTLDGTADANSNMQISKTVIPLMANHVYVLPPIAGFVPNASKKVSLSGIKVGNGNGGVWKNTNSYSGVYIRMDFYSGDTFSNLKIIPQLFDLTQMFGSTIADHIYSLEQATAGAGVALFKSLFPKDYYAYDAGSMQSVSGLSEHRTVGFNQWDEEWETYSTNQIKGKNNIPLIPGATYYIKAPINCNIYFRKTATESSFANFSGYNTTFTVPEEAHYGILYSGVGYGTTYNHDICINLSDPAKNGTYEPYDGHTYALDDSLTLRGIPTLVDGKIKWDGDVYSPSGKVSRRYAYADLGEQEWYYNSTQGFFYCSPSGMKSGTTNVIIVGYVQKADATGWGDMTDYEFGVSGTTIRLHNSNYTSSADFKAAVSGKYVVYEKATPTTEQADPYVSPQICDYDGTEEFVSTGIVPIGHVTKYPDNMRAKLDGLPWNFATLIAPVESGFKATRNYTTGALLIVNNVLYKATANIANGATITPNTNVTATTLAEVIAALA